MRMPFRFCNAPATFKYYMASILFVMVEDTIVVFMDDFLVMGNYFDDCLDNLANIV